MGSELDGVAANDGFGYSVSLSKDGNILAVGAKAHDNSKGHTRVFKWNGNAWAQMGADIDGQAAGDESGYSVSLNANGTKLAIGAPKANASKGKVRVFQWNGNAWVLFVSDIEDIAAAVAQFGNSLQLNDLGNRVAIGNFQWNGGKGSVQVWGIALPTVTLSVNPASIGENGVVSTVTATLSSTLAITSQLVCHFRYGNRRVWITIWLLQPLQYLQDKLLERQRSLQFRILLEREVKL